MDLITPATLLGLSIVAGTFLILYKPHDKYIEKIRIAITDFFKAFHVFIISTIIILVIDAIDVLFTNFLVIEVIDIIAKYSLFMLVFSIFFEQAKMLY